MMLDISLKDKDSSTKITKITKKMDENIWYREECYQIQGAVFEVYREMGCGFLEAVYQECLEKEFTRQGVPFQARQELKLRYKDEPLRQTYIPDFICYESIIIEIKALSVTAGGHKHRC